MLRRPAPDREARPAAHPEAGRSRLAWLSWSLAAAVVAATSCGGAQAPAASGPRPSAASPSGAVLSRGVPAFATNAIYDARLANDGDYATQFRGTPPTSLAYDLSRVPSERRRRLLIAWYNEQSLWDAGAINAPAYNRPRDYTVEANVARGGGAPPGGGWVTLARVTGNVHNSRLHVLDTSGFNWIRMGVTAASGAAGNADAAFDLDVQEAAAAGDAWLLLGDSITEDDMAHATAGPTFSQLVNAALPGHFPPQQDGGIGGWDSAAPLKVDPATGQQYLAEFLAGFPGRFVGLAFGTNDANQNVSAQAYEDNMARMVTAVQRAGKTPVVPLIPWGCTRTIAADGPAINAAVRDLWRRFPAVVHGPDFWSYFAANRGLLSQDCIHPTLPDGARAYRQLYVRTMLREVYGVTASESP
jgi:hypothetical protein